MFENWSLLKRNRMICIEAAVNGKFCLEKRIFFVTLPEKNRNFSEICLEKLIFFGSTTPQISNQIDAAAKELLNNVC